VPTHNPCSFFARANGALVWSFTTGADVVSSPVVAGGVVYVGSYDGNVYALNASTGNKIWNYATGYGVLSSPAIAEGKVYMSSVHGSVYAFGVSALTVGDLNGDGKVGLADLVALAQAYGSRSGDLNWNPNADIDGNSIVGLYDLALLAQHYGQHSP